MIPPKTVIGGPVFLLTNSKCLQKNEFRINRSYYPKLGFAPTQYILACRAKLAMWLFYRNVMYPIRNSILKILTTHIFHM